VLWKICKVEWSLIINYTQRGFLVKVLHATTSGLLGSHIGSLVSRFCHSLNKWFTKIELHLSPWEEAYLHFVHKKTIISTLSTKNYHLLSPLWSWNKIQKIIVHKPECDQYLNMKGKTCLMFLDICAPKVIIVVLNHLKHCIFP